MPSQHFMHLENRCNHLISRFLEPAIATEQACLRANQSVPTPDFDDFAAFRLLTHAELEGYFEAKAKDAITALDRDFSLGKIHTTGFVKLIYLYIWIQKRSYSWTEKKVDDASNLRNLAQEALGFGRQFIKENNGIKEASIQVLSGLMGFFPDDLDQMLVNELNDYGKNRGAVAHSSWHFNKRTFTSAEIEKNKLTTILDLTKKFYEN